MFVIFRSAIGFAQTDGKQIQHEIVFFEDGKYDGGLANHGICIWGNKTLTGFIEASYNEITPRLPAYDIPSSKNRYARSMAGGVTW